jgi:hypothetical protein
VSARTGVWFSGVWLVAPVTFVLLQMFVAPTTSTNTGYPLAEQVRGYSAAVLVFPVWAAAAAVAGGRMRGSNFVKDYPNRRSLLRILAPQVIWIAIPSAAALVIGVNWISWTQTDRWDPSWSLAFSSVAAGIAYTSVGYALGLLLRGVVAVPLALLIPYVLIGWPPALETPWIRHMFWVSSGCCQIYQELLPRAFGAYVVTALAILALAIGLIASAHNARVTMLIAMALAVGGGYTAVALARPLGYTEVDARSTESLNCGFLVDFELCLWPEHEMSRDTVADTLTQAHAIAKVHGLPTPVKVTEASPGQSWPRAYVDLPPAAGADGVIVNAVDSLLPITWSCGPLPWQSGIAELTPGWETDASVLRHWWHRQLGLSHGPPPPVIAAQVARLEELSDSELHDALMAMYGGLIDRQARCLHGE